jgi:hypothetical protein
MKLKFLRRFQHPSAPTSGYQFVEGRVFTNGGQNYAFNSWPLPLQDVIGPATAAGALRILQLPQVYVQQAVPIVGLGGLQAGQLITQPLVNPDFSPVESEGGGE